MSDRAQVVVVTPVFNEEEGLEEYAATVTRVLLENPDTDFRVILVDDGSSDRSWELIEQISTRDPRFRGVRLSRNFGSHVALSAGFAHVGPEAGAAATLACDLQDPPETILEFVEKWREGSDIVWGERLSRQDSGWKVATSKLFNRALMKHAMPQGSKFTTGSFLLVDRIVLDCFNEFKEHNRITFALVAWTGFDQVRVPYHRVARTSGTSGWSFPKMLKSMYDAFIGLSTLPIRVMKWAAILALLFSVILIGYTVGPHPADRDECPRLGQPDDRRGRVLRRAVHPDGDRRRVPQPDLHRVDATAVLLRQPGHRASPERAAAAAGTARQGRRTARDASRLGASSR